MSSFRVAGSELRDSSADRAPDRIAALTADRAPRGHRAPPAPDFGPHVRVLDPCAPTAELQAALDAAAGRQSAGGPGAVPTTFLLRPGSYDLDVRLGPGCSLAGLGLSPGDVTLTRPLHLDGALHDCWPPAQNLTARPARGADRTVLAQAAALRRLRLRDRLIPRPRQGGPAERALRGEPERDVAAGPAGAAAPPLGRPADGPNPGQPGGTWHRLPASGGQDLGMPTAFGRHKPFLYVDGSCRYRVFVPALRRDAPGAAGGEGRTPGSSVPIEQFFVARPADSVRTVNKELAQGKHLLLTPGVYRLAGTIAVKWAGTVVLGLGAVTLVPATGAVPLRVDDVRGVRIAGLRIDAAGAGPHTLLEVGTGRGRRGDPLDPAAVQDVFLRPRADLDRTGTALVLGSEHVLLDHVWVWHAGRPGAPRPASWPDVTAPVDVTGRPGRA